MTLAQKVGDRIFFKEEKRPYRVRACNDRFLICTKPYNPRHTVLYTIVDLKNGIRGAENLIFCAGFESDQDCNEALERLVSGETEISRRNRTDVHITKIIPA